MRTLVIQLAVVLMASLLAVPVRAESWDVGARAAEAVSSESGGKVVLTLEQRTRYERRTGQGFGQKPDLTTGLARTRLGVILKPVTWLQFAATLQDSRAPWYGPGATAKVREPVDLWEAYVEILPDSETGFGLSVGRRRISYGEGRLLATSNWGNVPQGHDHARIYYRLPQARLEVFFLSRVQTRLDGFNRPELDQRAWGTYNTFPDVLPGGQLDVYAFRHDQTRMAADGSGRLGINTFGSRLTGPLWEGATFSLEGALQTGGTDSVRHRAGAWYSGVRQRWTPGGRALSVSGEYKYASGTDDPSDVTRTATFDPAYPSNHNKYGHQDLFGWRNLHNIRALVTFEAASGFDVNFLYNSNWLASPRDSVYTGSGSSIVRSASGTDGRHVGEEPAVFVTYEYGSFEVGAGYAYLIAGDFLKATTPGVNPSYVYFFHMYSF